MVCLGDSRSSSGKRKIAFRVDTQAATGCALDMLPMHVDKRTSVRIGQRCRDVMSTNSSTSNMAARVSSCLWSDSRRQFGEALSRATTAKGSKSATLDVKTRPKSSPPNHTKFQARSLHSARANTPLTSRDAGVTSRCSHLSIGGARGASRLSHTGPSRYKQDLLESFRLPFYEKSVCQP